MQRIILMRGHDKNNSREREIENNTESKRKREREKKETGRMEFKSCLF